MKRIAICILVVLMIVTLTACGGGKDVDLDALAGELTASAAFTMDMTQFQASESVIAGTYGFDAGEVTKCSLYVNTGTAEEIFLAQAKDSKAADRLEELCKTRVEAQTTWMQSYVPEAVPRLQNAIIAKSGSYVVMVVADDSAAAKSIVDGYMK